MLSLFLAASMAFPEVVHHAQTRTLPELRAECQRVVTEQERPCVTIEIDDSVCIYIYPVDGEETKTNCYRREVEE